RRCACCRRWASTGRWTSSGWSSWWTRRRSAPRWRARGERSGIDGSGTPASAAGRNRNVPLRPLFGVDRDPPAMPQAVLDEDRVERLVGRTLGEMVHQLDHVRGSDALADQHGTLAVAAGQHLPHVVKGTASTLRRGEGVVNLSLRRRSLMCPFGSRALI